MRDQPRERRCPHCHSSNSAESLYCSHCGSPFEVESTQSYVAEPRQAYQAPDGLDFPPGQVFAGRYLIIEELGRGGMGRVFKAKDQKLGLTVALKMIRPEHSASAAVIDLFKKETLLARSLAQENIIRIFDLGESRGLTFISMEYVPGQNLGQVLRASGALTEDMAVSITRQVCQALAAAHSRGIVHRDLKPQNILIDPNGRVHLADFGLAKSLEALESTRAGGVVGTPAYLSPEQARGEKTDARTDIYALGVIMYEMLTGLKPFESDSAAGYIEKHIHDKPKPPSAWNPRIPSYLEKIVLRCLDKAPAKRYQGADEVLAVLAAGISSIPLPGARKRKSILAWSLAGAAALALAVFGLFHFVLRTPPGPPAPPEERISVAVMYFENQTGDPNLDYLRTNLNTQVIQALLQSRYVRVITEDRLLAILNEQKLQDRQKYSTEDLKRVAAKAQVKHILQGMISKIGQEFSIYSVLHDTGTWEPVANEQEKGIGIDSLNGMVDRLIRQIKADLKLSRQQINNDIAAPVKKITTDSQEALREYVSGKMLYYEGKFQESSQAFQRALNLDPEFAMASWGLGLDALEQGQSARSKAFLEKALAAAAAGRVSPREHYLIQGFYATLYSPSIQDAIEPYQKLLALYPDDEEGNIFLGTLYRNLEDWDLAAERFETAQRVNAYNEATYLNLVDIQMARGLYSQARQTIESRLGYMSKAFADYHLSRISLGQGLVDQALVEIKAALDEAPEQPRFLFFMGLCHQLRGETDQARQVFSALLRNPNIICQLSAISYLGQVALQEGRWAACDDLISQGILRTRTASLKNQEGLFFCTKAWLELLRNNPLSALGHAKSALAICNTLSSDVELRIQALYVQGMALFKNKQWDEGFRAARDMQQLAEKNGNRRHMSYYYNLMGRYYLETHNAALAVDFCSMAISLLPSQHSESEDEHAYRYQALAEAYGAQGDWDRARKYYESIIGLTYGRLQWGPIYAQSFYRLGKIYGREGLKDKARTAYARFLELWRNADAGCPEVDDARRELKRLGEPPARPTSSQNSTR